MSQILEKLCRIEELLTQNVSGVIIESPCEGGFPIPRNFGGQGLIGLQSLNEVISDQVDTVNRRTCEILEALGNIEEPVAALPEVFQVRAPNDFDRAMAVYREIDPNSSSGLGQRNGQLRIPYFNTAIDSPTLPDYRKGNVLGTAQFPSGAQMSVYAESQATAQQVLDAMLALVIPARASQVGFKFTTVNTNRVTQVYTARFTRLHVFLQDSPNRANGTSNYPDRILSLI